MINVQIDIPEALAPFVSPTTEQKKLIRNAMLIFPSIQDETISYGRAAEILNLKKLDLITLYGSLGLPYFNQPKDELKEELQTVKPMSRPSEKIRAFRELETMRINLPEDFDPDKERMTALEEKYGTVD